MSANLVVRFDHRTRFGKLHIEVMIVAMTVPYNVKCIGRQRVLRDENISLEP